MMFKGFEKFGTCLFQPAYNGLRKKLHKSSVVRAVVYPSMSCCGFDAFSFATRPKLIEEK